MKPKLIIFDCDGTLVDSEYVYNAITAKLLNESGYPEYTPELCMELFGGLSWSTIRAELELRHQMTMPDDMIAKFISTANSAMGHDDIKATKDADAALLDLKGDFTLCVASNGERNNVLKSLEVTGLLRHFKTEHIFTKIQVARPKPAPDLFLFACDRMGYAPSEALVIEDSIAGVRAAVAAGIRVLGYSGSSHAPEKTRKNLKDTGALEVLDQLIHIRKHLAY